MLEKIRCFWQFQTIKILWKVFYETVKGEGGEIWLVDHGLKIPDLVSKH